MKAVHYKNPQILGANVNIWLLRRSGVRNLCPPTLNTQRGMSRAARTLRIQIHPTASRKLGNEMQSVRIVLVHKRAGCHMVWKSYEKLFHYFFLSSGNDCRFLQSVFSKHPVYV
jgi:hypothetical protein